MADPAEVVDFIRQVNEGVGDIRAQELEDLKFRFGEQWPVEIINSRKLQERPRLTINETDSYVRQVVNQIRQQRPRIKVHPIDSRATKKVAEVLSGLTRHVEVNSNAANAYDLAADFAVTMGEGYWRLRADYVREDSFDQDIYIDPVQNPFGVYFDTNSVLPDGSDAQRAAIAEMMPKREFLKQYPGAMMGNFTERGAGDVDPEWMTKDAIRVAEFYYVDMEAAKLCKLSDGTVAFEDELPPKGVLDQAGVRLIGDRRSFKRQIKWCKVTALQQLDEKDIPGRYIPVVPVYGVNVIIGGKRHRFGMVRHARDPQNMVNFWQTCITESVALAPKAKWVMAAGQDEGFEAEWRSANSSPLPVLHYNILDAQGQPIGPPQRQQPEPPPEGAMMAAMNASDNLRRVLGIYDPGVRSATHKSDKTINAEAQQSEMTNFHFYDNVTCSIAHTGRIILGWTPTIWDVERVQRIIGADGRPKLITLNQKIMQPPAQGPLPNAPAQANEETAAIIKVLNDVTVGTYDVEMETGPGYNSKRQESLTVLTEMLGTPLGEQISKLAGDLIVRLVDAPYMDVIADRLAAANPLAGIDEESEIPAPAQAMILALRKQLDDAHKLLTQAGIELKYGIGKEQAKQQGETEREQIRAGVKVHDTAQIAATKRHDTEMRSVTAQNVEEIKGIVAMLLKHVDTHQLKLEIEARDREQQAKAAEVEAGTPAGA
jgi:hypothetical protein